MTDNPDRPTNQRLADIETRLEGMDGEFRRQYSFLLDGLIALSEQTTALTNRVDLLTESQQQLAQLMVQFTRNGEADRAVIREMQAEVRQIWQYLLSQRPNGGQPGG